MYHARIEGSRPRIAVVVGSNRSQRICPEIAAWVQSRLHAAGLVEAELVDLQEVDLPFLDEPILPAPGRYEHAHTVRWSELVRSYNGFVFVFPQYNWGYPAVLKNALDFLYHGSRGSGLAATQLKQVLQGLHTTPTRHSPTTSPRSPRLPSKLNHLATTMAETSHRDPRPRNQAREEIT
jgi:NAD(P)H-dependent FMN reductase